MRTWQYLREDVLLLFQSPELVWLIFFLTDAALSKSVHCDIHYKYITIS